MPPFQLAQCGIVQQGRAQAWQRLNSIDFGHQFVAAQLAPVLLLRADVRGVL